ncbi:MAG: preprotein translocase subunit SecY [Chloroflexi bacterium]|nr:preprotein translocase subunit SecY [Chloroflexota bacterium]MCH8065377.1 preprotein translocase subunit SecY [Chloroflexota bacterium]
MLQAVLDAFQQPDIRRKLLLTIGLLVVFRFVAHVPIPGVNRDLLELAFEDNAILGFLNLFSGGALRNLSVAALGVYPYITSSIIMQLMVPIVPSLQALSREGEQGRNRIQLYTHYLAVPMAVVQGYSQLVILQQAGAVSGIGFTGPEALPTLSAVISMTAGTMFLVWIGELITENGIGNGISLIIFGGIVAGLPTLFPSIVSQNVGLFSILAMVAIGIAVLASIVFVQEAQRRIPVQYAKSVFRSGRMYRQSGQSHIPLRVNSAGMIPLIFAFSIVIFPPVAAQFMVDQFPDAVLINNVGNFVIDWFSPQGSIVSPVFIGTIFLLVMVFTFFYTLVVFQQQNLAENLQKNGGFVPGIRPGRPTAEYIMRVLVRITWGGAIFLGLIAIMPYVLPYVVTGFRNVNTLTLTGTGLLIIVGVVLDTMRQLESQLMMRNYEGFIR